MADRLLSETERLRSAIRDEAWPRAVAICRRITERLEKLAHENVARPARPVPASTTPTVAPPIADCVPLRDLAHEAKLDRRTTVRRLKKRGVPVHQWGGVPIVERAAGLAAVQSFDRSRSA
jgi:hypothetical protein